MKMRKICITVGLSILSVLIGPSTLGQTPSLVSINSAGTDSGNGSESILNNPEIGYGNISANGRFVAFHKVSIM
jgi:hypothetical protein